MSREVECKRAVIGAARRSTLCRPRRCCGGIARRRALGHGRVSIGEGQPTLTFEMPADVRASAVGLTTRLTTRISGFALVNVGKRRWSRNIAATVASGVTPMSGVRHVGPRRAWSGRARRVALRFARAKSTAQRTTRNGVAGSVLTFAKHQNSGSLGGRYVRHARRWSTSHTASTATSVGRFSAEP
jgi:hypothetical protein